jgi:hypothetical protein
MFLGIKGGRHVRVITSPPSVSLLFRTVVFYPGGYAKTSYGVCKSEKKNTMINTE